MYFRFVDQVTQFEIRFRLLKYAQNSKYNFLLFSLPSQTVV